MLATTHTKDNKGGGALSSLVQDVPNLAAVVEGASANSGKAGEDGDDTERVMIQTNNTTNDPTTNENQPALLCYSATSCGFVDIDNSIQKLRQRGDGLLTKFKQQRRRQQLQKLVNNVRAGSSLYDPSLYLCGTGMGRVSMNPTDEASVTDGVSSSVGTDLTTHEGTRCGIDFALFDEEDRIDFESQPIPASDLSDPDRTICVVTTAAMPWRTGTAVNPLLRALYLVRYQEEERKRRHGCVKIGEDSADYDDRFGNQSEYIHGRGSVVLVIPWLESEEDRIRLYGPNNSFSYYPDATATSETNTSATNSSTHGDNCKNDKTVITPTNPSETLSTVLTSMTAEKYGMAQQEAWIRHYSSTACGMPNEASQLQIIFYPAFYLSGFGSIFPKVDLCNYIPEHLVDVAILEEPEHLNWFRMPSYEVMTRDDHEKSEEGDEVAVDKTIDTGNDTVTASPLKVEVSLNAQASSSSDKCSSSVAERVASSIKDIKIDDKNTTNNTANETSIEQKSCKKNMIEEAKKLGWTHRFRFVLGIVHTNYEEYARQYGIGVSLIAAPAIGAISALIIRAHCHQVIKLSNTLPNFAPGKEVTCNVHGVRREFLEGVDMTLLESSYLSELELTEQDNQRNTDEGREIPPSISPVYFIGKLVWAKGFDLMLDLQDIFRRKYGTYFCIDIYGGGPDEKAIARAFHGRNHAIPSERPPPTPSAILSISKESSALSLDSSLVDGAAEIKVLDAATVLTNPQSIKAQSGLVLAQLKRQTSLLQSDGDDVVSQYLSLGFEVSQINGSATYVKESRRRLQAAAAPTADEIPDDELTSSSQANPFEILGDFSGKSFDTGIKTGLAVYNIADSSIKKILTMSFSQLQNNSLKGKMQVKTIEDGKEGEVKKQFVFDPPISRYEWRRRPIPAKFPGVVDHALIKSLPHKIFLNPSTSEVLCTTTAEAIAMNKFVIIPKHPSNEFFEQFTNCLLYDNLDECADKMDWALKNTPTQLSDRERKLLTWEAATERLMESSLVTVKQARERAENGMDKTDSRIAYWLSESGEKSNMIRNLFNKTGGDRSPKIDG